MNKGTVSPERSTLSPEEGTLSSKEGPDIEHVNMPVVNREKKKDNIKEIACLNCGKVFTAARSTQMYCSNACKEAYRRKLKKENS